MHASDPKTIVPTSLVDQEFSNIVWLGKDLSSANLTRTRFVPGISGNHPMGLAEHGFREQYGIDRHTLAFVGGGHVATGPILDGCKCIDGQISQCRFVGARMQDLFLDNVDVQSTVFKKCSLRRAKVGNSRLLGVTSHSAIMPPSFEMDRAVIFDSCDLSGCEFRNCLFQSVVFRSCDMYRTRFVECSFVDCLFINSNLSLCLDFETTKASSSVSRPLRNS